jgi:hypothetical protein
MVVVPSPQLCHVSLSSVYFNNHLFMFCLVFCHSVGCQPQSRKHPEPVPSWRQWQQMLNVDDFLTDPKWSCTPPWPSPPFLSSHVSSCRAQWYLLLQLQHCLLHLVELLARGTASPSFNCILRLLVSWERRQHQEWQSRMQGVGGVEWLTVGCVRDRCRQFYSSYVLASILQVREGGEESRREALLHFGQL